MSPLRKPVSFLKNFDQELQQGKLNQNEVNQKLQLIDANVDMIADVLQDNPGLTDVLSSILNRSWKLMAQEQGAIPPIVKKIQAAAVKPLYLEVLSDEITSKIDEMCVPVSQSMLEKMHRESPLMKREFPDLDEGKLTFKGKCLMASEWEFIVSFYESKDFLPIHRSFAYFERCSNLIRFCHRYGLKEAEHYFIFILRENLLKSAEYVPTNDQAYNRVRQIREAIDLGFECDNKALKIIGVDGYLVAIKAITNFYLNEVKNEYAGGNLELEFHLNTTLYLLGDVLRSEWKRTLEDHGLFDPRLGKPQAPYRDLFRKIAELPIRSNQLEKRNEILLQFIKGVEGKNGWNFDEDPAHLLQIVLRITPDLESKLKEKRKVRQELKTFFTQFPYGFSTLDVRHIPLKYGHLTCLKGLHGLKELKVNGENISAADRERLKKKLPGIAITI